MSRINIAIDGPSGVGKSTIADIVADKLKYIHLDTGAMYRCVAYFILKNHVNYKDENVLQHALNDIDISFKEGRVYLNDEDVTELIRTNDISMLASKTSALAPVRTKMVDLQKNIASSKGYILDGRDICTVVLPDAEVKIFMNADAKARAQRRYDEYIKKGIDADYEVIYQDIVARDYQDSHRKISPFKKSDQFFSKKISSKFGKSFTFLSLIKILPPSYLATIISFRLTTFSGTILNSDKSSLEACGIKDEFFEHITLAPRLPPPLLT